MKIEYEKSSHIHYRMNNMMNGRNVQHWLMTIFIGVIDGYNDSTLAKGDYN